MIVEEDNRIRGGERMSLAGRERSELSEVGWSCKMHGPGPAAL